MAPVPVSDLRTVFAQTVVDVVRDTQGNLSEAARRLGISRTTLYRKLVAARSETAPASSRD